MGPDDAGSAAQVVGSSGPSPVGRMSARIWRTVRSSRSCSSAGRLSRTSAWSRRWIWTLRSLRSTAGQREAVEVADQPVDHHLLAARRRVDLLVRGDEGPAVDDRRRDGLGPEEGAQLQQADGGRRALAELVDRRPPHGADGAGVAGQLLGRAPARAGRSAARCRWSRGCRSPCSQAAAISTKMGRSPSVSASRSASSRGEGRHLAPEELDALGPGEGVDVDRLHARVRGHGAVPGGHQHVGRPGDGHEGQQLLVPAGLRRCRRSAATGRRCSPCWRCCTTIRLASSSSGAPRRPGRDQAEGRRQLGQALLGEGRVLAGDPPDDVVVGLEPVGVLERDLGLAHATEAVQDLGAGRRRRPRRRSSPQLFEDGGPGP